MSNLQPDEMDAWTTCRACGATIVVVTQVAGKSNHRGPRMALNPDLEEGGNVEVRANRQSKLFGKVVGPDPERKLYTLHAETCEGRRR